MDPQDPTSQDLSQASPPENRDGRGFGTDEPMRIHLGEIPAPRVPSSRPVEPEPEKRIEVPILGIEHPSPKSTRFAAIRNWFGQGYFDPARAFEEEVDWARFGRAQVYLFLLSLSTPFLMLLVFGFLFGLVYSIGASLYSVTSPNSIAELMIYPFIFVLARGYWLSYLALPIAMFITGWVWAVLSAWALSLGGNALLDFKRGLGITAMLGAMMAPFTMFPFLRWLILAALLRLLVRRMEDTFGASFWKLSGRVGLILLGSGLLYGSFERKVEEIYPAGESLRVHLDDFLRLHRRLEWPPFHTRLPIGPHEQLFADLSDFDPLVRERAVKKSLTLLEAGTEPPELRYRLAKRMADNGQAEAFLYAARHLAAGQGTEVDLPAAIDWMRKYTEVNPTLLEAGLEKARLLFLAGRKLEGKVSLVQLTKAHIKDLNRITSFIQKENLGQIDQTFTYEVQSLYQQGNVQTYAGSYQTFSPSQGTRYVTEYQTKQDALLKKLYASERDKGLWYYRALAVEYARSAIAGPEIYGESSTDYQAAELEQKLKEGDRVALDTAADRCFLHGDVVKARQYWLAATRALNDDDRRTNVPLYLKLAQSYDPEDSNQDPNPKEAEKFYLAALLISKWNGRMDPVGLGPLQRLHQGKLPDPMGQPYLDLCLKFDIPEAWVMMGDRYFNGDFQGVPKNVTKARDCFLRAKALGYQGPQLLQQLAGLNHVGQTNAYPCTARTEVRCRVPSDWPPNHHA